MKTLDNFDNLVAQGTSSLRDPRLTVEYHDLPQETIDRLRKYFDSHGYGTKEAVVVDGSAKQPCRILHVFGGSSK